MEMEIGKSYLVLPLVLRFVVKVNRANPVATTRLGREKGPQPLSVNALIPSEYSNDDVTHLDRDVLSIQIHQK